MKNFYLEELSYTVTRQGDAFIAHCHQVPLLEVVGATPVEALETIVAQAAERLTLDEGSAPHNPSVPVGPFGLVQALARVLAASSESAPSDELLMLTAEICRDAQARGVTIDQLAVELSMSRNAVTTLLGWGLDKRR